PPLNGVLARKRDAGEKDACSSVTWSTNVTALTKACGATGSATVTFTATDACGNASTTTATFTIKDTTKPTIVTAAANKTVETDESGNAAGRNAGLPRQGGAAGSDEWGRLE